MMVVLVVDPYRHSRQGLRTSLVEMGYQVETAANLAEAIALIDMTHFDVAVIDLDLPRWSAPPGGGWELAVLCRALNPDAAIVVVSSEIVTESVARSEELGAELLAKPISPARLRGIVRALAHGGRGT